MSRLLYFDCFSGISGDMVLGALLDAGLPFEELQRALGSLAVSGFEISTKRVLRAGVMATQFLVHDQSTQHPAPTTQHDHSHSHHHDHSAHESPHAHPHRSLAEIFA